MRLFTLGLLLSIASFLTAQTNHAVEVRSNVYDPASLTIQVGDTVTWTNVQGVHNVNGSSQTYPANPVGFRSGNAMPPPWTFQFVFDTPGTYNYQCDPHLGLGMVGEITVEGASGGTIAITEIMYNPPEAGNDSLEYIELYNYGTEAVDMTNWTTFGFVFTFPEFTLEAGQFVILVINEAAFNNVFSYSGPIFQWEAGALSNGGELLEIRDANGELVDAVNYDDVAPWPTEPDGSGPSLVRCDPTTDGNDASNWRAASTGTGVIINGFEVLGDPGVLNTCGAPTPALFWLRNSVTLNEDAGTISVGVVAQNFVNGFGPEIMVALDGNASTATPGDDFTTNPALPISFNSGETMLDTFFFEVSIVDDVLEEMTEEIVFVLSGNGEIGNANSRIIILDNDTEVVVTPIANINGVDANGVATSAGQTVSLQGVVQCLDFRANNGYEFWIIEPATGDGIFVFSGSDVSGYTNPTEGEELLITGELVQFRGLLEIVPTSIIVVSTGNAPATAIPTEVLNESLESQYVELSFQQFVENNPFVRAGGGFNLSAILNNGDTIIVRVEDEIGVDSSFLANFISNPNAIEYTITGLVYQRDFDSPFDAFYQLYPCGAESFQFIVSTREPAWAAGLKIYPNPTHNWLQVEASSEVEQYRLFDMNGRLLQSDWARGQAIRLDLSQLPTGMYQLQFIGQGGSAIRPVIKQ